MSGAPPSSGVPDSDLLARIARSLVSSDRVGRILAAVCQATAQLCRGDRCGIFLVDPEAAGTVPGMSAYADGRRAEAEWKKFRELGPRPLSEMRLTNRVVTTRQPALIDDARASDELEPFVVELFGTCSLMTVPIELQERVFGTLSVETVGEVRPFGPAQVTLAQAVADQLALFIHTRILMERLEQRLRETRQALADLEQAQEALVHGERLRALGGLASGAAHHLNNILAVIVGRVDLLLDDVTDAARRRPLEAVAKAARDAAEIVRRVSEFARVRPRHGRRAVDLGAIVRDTLEATRQLWDLPGIELVTSIDPVPSLAGDAVALRDAVVHLVTNAVEAVPDGGRIAVTTRVADARVELLVENSGAGMTEDVRQRAFEPFFTTKGVQRRGLGLSAAYGIVTDHGGVIAIASEPGRGTRVTVQLPATVS